MNATPIRVAVSGAAGRMGRMLVAAVASADDLRLTGAVARRDSPESGADAGALAGIGRLGIPIAGDLADVEDFDVLVDFSVASATLDMLGFCTAYSKALVIGTTGFEAAEVQAIRRAAETVPIVLAPNMSVGVNIVFQLIEFAARTLGDDVDVEVLEAHHRHKIDAPSGTAVRMGEILADTLGRDLATDAVYGRRGVTGERGRRSIGFHSLRGGDIVGEHTVTFAGTGERIEITHRAGSRGNFTAGAVRAVRFVAGRTPGLYGMDAVLGL